MKRVLIIGAGGHAQVVADILLRAAEAGGDAQPIGFLDDDPELLGARILGLPVIGPLASLGETEHDAVIVGIGDNRKRSQIFEELGKKGEEMACAVHPAARLAPDVQLGKGVMVCAGVVVNVGTVVGEGVILNTGCTVDHHNHIEAHAHIAPGAHLGGDVRIGAQALVGIGAAVIPGCSVGEGSVVGAGAAVVSDIPDHAKAVGVPARVVEVSVPLER